MKKRITALGLGLSLILGQMGMPAVNASTLHSVPVDLSGYYNIKQIYADSAPSTGYTNAGADGDGRSWYYGQEFKDNTTVGWTKSWSEVSGDINTLTSQGVEFQLKVSTDTDEAVAVAHLTNEAGWKDIDLTDAKYSSLEFLMTFAMSGDKWRNAEIRLNYTDNSVEYKEIKPLKMTEESNSDATTAKGKITLKGASNKTEEHDGDAYIHHYSIATNPEKVLGSISLLSYNYDYTKDASGNIEYEEDGKTAKLTSLNSQNASATKDKNIYAITGMLTSDEFDKIQPVYKPIALPYNVDAFKTNQDNTTLSGGVLGSNKGSICADIFKAGTSVEISATSQTTELKWLNSWGTGTENIFTYGSNKVQFKVRVDETGTQKGAFISNSGNQTTDTGIENDTGAWTQLDVDNYSYNSIELLTRGTTDGNTYRSIELRLRYTDGSYDIKQFTVPKLNTTTEDGATASDAIIRAAGTKDSGATKSTVFIHHYSVPADETKVLDKIDVLNYAQNLTLAANGEISSLSGSVGANYQGGIIFAMTGVTTLAEEKKRQDEIADNMPVFLYADIPYNVANIYGDGTGNLGNAGGNGSAGEVYYYNDFINSTTVGWKPGTTWINNDVNVLVNENVEFELKVVNDETTPVAFFNKTITASDTDPVWEDIDLEDTKYKSVDMLMAFALSSTGTLDVQEIRLNYADGTHQYFEYTVKKANQTDSTGAIGAVATPAYLAGNQSATGRMHHYSIPADSNKALTGISVLSYNYSYDKDTEGQYQYETDGSIKVKQNNASSKGVTKAVNIYAVTGVTTVKEMVYTIEGAKKVYNDEADTVTVTGTVRKSPTIAPKAYLAFYIDGKLTGIEDISGATTLNHTFTNATKDGTVKYFVWNQGMKPYKDSREITAQ